MKIKKTQLQQIINEEKLAIEFLMQELLREDFDNVYPNSLLLEIDLLDLPGTFADWVKKNSEWIKKTVGMGMKSKEELIQRLDHLKDEGVSISPDKVQQLQDRVRKARDPFQLFSIFYHAAIAQGNPLDRSVKQIRAQESLVKEDAGGGGMGAGPIGGGGASNTTGTIGGMGYNLPIGAEGYSKKKKKKVKKEAYDGLGFTKDYDNYMMNAVSNVQNVPDDDEGGDWTSASLEEEEFDPSETAREFVYANKEYIVELCNEYDDDIDAVVDELIDEEQLPMSERENAIEAINYLLYRPSEMYHDEDFLDDEGEDIIDEEYSEENEKKGDPWGEGFLAAKYKRSKRENPYTNFNDAYDWDEGYKKYQEIYGGELEEQKNYLDLSEDYDLDQGIAQPTMTGLYEDLLLDDEDSDDYNFDEGLRESDDDYDDTEEDVEEFFKPDEDIVVDEGDDVDFQDGRTGDEQVYKDFPPDYDSEDGPLYTHDIQEKPELDESAPPGREKQVRALKKKFPKGSSSPFAIAWASYNKTHKKK